MLTDKNLRERADQMAFAEYFCNVDDVDWPNNPWALLSNDTFFSDDDKYCLVAWEPFAHETAKDLCELVENASESFYYNLKRARDNAA